MSHKQQTTTEPTSSTKPISPRRTRSFTRAQQPESSPAKKPKITAVHPQQTGGRGVGRSGGGRGYGRGRGRGRTADVPPPTDEKKRESDREKRWEKRETQKKGKTETTIQPPTGLNASAPPFIPMPQPYVGRGGRGRGFGRRLEFGGRGRGLPLPAAAELGFGGFGGRGGRGRAGGIGGIGGGRGRGRAHQPDDDNLFDSFSSIVGGRFTQLLGGFGGSNDPVLSSFSVNELIPSFESHSHVLKRPLDGKDNPTPAPKKRGDFGFHCAMERLRQNVHTPTFGGYTTLQYRHTPLPLQKFPKIPIRKPLEPPPPEPSILGEFEILKHALLDIPLGVQQEELKGCFEKSTESPNFTKIDAKHCLVRVLHSLMKHYVTQLESCPGAASAYDSIKSFIESPNSITSYFQPHNSTETLKKFNRRLYLQSLTQQQRNYIHLKESNTTPNSKYINIMEQHLSAHETENCAASTTTTTTTTTTETTETSRCTDVPLISIGWQTIPKSVLENRGCIQLGHGAGCKTRETGTSFHTKFPHIPKYWQQQSAPLSTPLVSLLVLVIGGRIRETPSIACTLPEVEPQGGTSFDSYLGCTDTMAEELVVFNTDRALPILIYE